MSCKYVMYFLKDLSFQEGVANSLSHTVSLSTSQAGQARPLGEQKNYICYFSYTRDNNCELLLLTETNGALDQPGVDRHRVGLKHREFQPKVSQTSFASPRMWK